MYEMPASRKNKGFAGIRKVFEKSFKKLLTKCADCHIIILASRVRQQRCDRKIRGVAQLG